MDGIGAAVKPEPHAQKLIYLFDRAHKMGLPQLTVPQATLISRVTGACSAALGIYFVVGKKKRTAAALLAANTVVIAAVNVAGQDESEPSEHRTKPVREIRKLKIRNLLDYGAGFGGLLLATVDREGKPSLKWKRHYHQQERELVRTVKEQAAEAVEAAQAAAHAAALEAKKKA